MNCPEPAYPTRNCNDTPAHLESQPSQRELDAWRSTLSPGDRVWVQTMAGEPTEHVLLSDCMGWFVDDRWKHDVGPTDLFPTKEEAKTVGPVKSLEIDRCGSPGDRTGHMHALYDSQEEWEVWNL